jgi:hypothetical protein
MKSSKPLIFLIVFFSIVTWLIVRRYELLLAKTRAETHFENVSGGAPHDKKYTAAEIVALIKGSKEYLGDSITIFDNGEMKSDNGKFQGTISAVITSKDNMDMVKGAMASNKLPIQYNIYVLAATYYRRQYPQGH